MQFLIASLVLVSNLLTVHGEPMRLRRQTSVVNPPSVGENTALQVSQVNGRNSQWLAPVSAGPLDFQNLMGNGIGNGNGGNPSNGQLPALPNLFAMPNDLYEGKLNREFLSKTAWIMCTMMKEFLVPQ
ncbi:hypothetical protein OSTOST_15380, partial [Ostertagia ostertagi]